jgi:hypothetical protein
MDLLNPLDRGLGLTTDQVNRAMKLLSNKIIKNPIFVGKEQKVTFTRIGLNSYIILNFL